MNRITIISAFFLSISFVVPAQKGQPVDRVIAVVGNNIIKQSQLESEYLQYLNQEMDVNEQTRCRILEELLYQRLLLAQAKKDSLVVSDAQVDQEIERRMRYYMVQFGTEERFRQFYGKSVDDFKAEIRDEVKELLMAQRMQGKITEGLTVTPSEVKAYFNSIHPDSIPFINAEIELAQIVKKPFISPEAKREAKVRCEKLMQEVIAGADFASKAALYSDDPGSAKNGGKYENIQRGQFVPEFEAVTWALKEKEISKVFETNYGYHFVQLLERRGDIVDLRHILIAPKTSSLDLVRSRNFLDSIYNRLMNPSDSLNFTDAAGKYSDDEDTRNSGGMIVNPQTGNTRFEMDELGQLDPTLVFAIDKMKVGEITKPTSMTTRDGKPAYRILCLKTRTEPHKANLKDDYQRLQAAALAEKQQRVMKAWIKKKLEGTYVRIADDYKNCKFENSWVKMNQ